MSCDSCLDRYDVKQLIKDAISDDVSYLIDEAIVKAIREDVRPLIEEAVRDNNVTIGESLLSVVNAMYPEAIERIRQEGRSQQSYQTELAYEKVRKLERAARDLRKKTKSLKQAAL